DTAELKPEEEWTTAEDALSVVNSKALNAILLYSMGWIRICSGSLKGVLLQKRLGRS
ncbi:hypothetical protein A2U01_0097525, partial [Trifolium medium]|nr:hypothetical protein [Trifolium medium]